MFSITLQKTIDHQIEMEMTSDIFPWDCNNEATASRLHHSKTHLNEIFFKIESINNQIVLIHEK